MSEPVKEQTDSEKVQDLTNQMNVQLHRAGSLAYNMEKTKEDISDAQLKVRNLVVDINKLNDKIAKEKAAELEAKKPKLVQEPSLIEGVADVVQ